MTLAQAIARVFPDRFRVLILDNEVTVHAFVAEPPLPWARLTGPDGVYTVAAGYPTQLDAAEAKREELNWDRVYDPAICAALATLGDTVDLVAFGNNAAQGLPLAAALPAALRTAHGAILYGRSLPEQAAYESLGYRRFCPRDRLLAAIAESAAASGRAPALAFINTIEHNERNYHTPWPG